MNTTKLITRLKLYNSLNFVGNRITFFYNRRRPCTYSSISILLLSELWSNSTNSTKHSVFPQFIFLTFRHSSKFNYQMLFNIVILTAKSKMMIDGLLHLFMDKLIGSLKIIFAYTAQYVPLRAHCNNRKSYAGLWNYTIDVLQRF